MTTVRDLHKVAEFTRHVKVVALSPDNQHIACGSEAAWVEYIYNPDGSIGNDGSVTVLDCVDKKVVCKLPTATDGKTVFRLAYNSDGRYLACVADDGLYVWRVEDRELVLKQPEGGTMLSGLLFVKSGRREQLVHVYWNTVEMRNTYNWKSKAKSTAWRQAKVDTAFQIMSGDGRLIAVIDNHTGLVSVWDLETERLKWTQSLPRTSLFVAPICFHPSGTMLAVRGAKSTVCIWDVSHGTLISELRVERGLTPASLAFSPDGSLLITGLWRLETEWNGEVVDVSSSYDSIVWDWEWGAPLAQLPGFGSDVVFSRDGSRLAIAGDHGVQVWATHKT